MPSVKELFVSTKRLPGGYFAPIDFGSIIISVQASAYHYCSPRIDLDDLNDYDSVEIAVFYSDGDNKSFVNIRSDKRFNDFEWAKMFESVERPVAGYVSFKDLERIIEDVKSVSNQMKN